MILKLFWNRRGSWRFLLVDAGFLCEEVCVVLSSWMIDPGSGYSCNGPSCKMAAWWRLCWWPPNDKIDKGLMMVSLMTRRCWLQRGSETGVVSACRLMDTRRSMMIAVRVLWCVAQEKNVAVLPHFSCFLLVILPHFKYCRQIYPYSWCEAKRLLKRAMQRIVLILDAWGKVWNRAKPCKD